MGNVTVVIKLVGSHHNASPFDAEQMSAEFVRKLEAAGHHIKHAGVTAGGREDDLLAEPSQLLPIREKEVITSSDVGDLRSIIGD